VSTEGWGCRSRPLKERFERLEEAVKICCLMWSDDNGPYEGRYYQLAETLCSPPPLSRPHPPILIGGGGEQKTLRLVARYGDASNLFATSPADVVHKLDVLRRHCDDARRDEREITKTILYHGDGLATGDHDRFLAEMADYAALGIQTVIVMPPGGDAATWIESACAPVAPRLADVR
jgi:Luciferase-like monooxygenase